MMEEAELDVEPIPSYVDFARGVVDFSVFFVQNPPGLSSFKSNWTAIKDEGIGTTGFALVIALAAGLTFARKRLTIKVFKPFGEWCGIPGNTQHRLSEYAWRFLFHSLCWSWEYHLVAHKYDFYRKPSLIFLNQEEKTDIPWEILLLYVAQSSYFLHALYCVVFEDVWRKDSIVMVCHHVLTLLLLFFSYTCKCTEVGLLLLLFHDCSDAFLELSKICKCMVIQNGKRSWVFDNLTKVVFAFFSVLWLVTRLYLYPLKVIHTISVNTLALKLMKTNFLYAGYLLNVVLLCMNFYWSVLLIQLLVRLATGRVTALADPRDFDAEVRSGPEEHDTKNKGD